MNVHRLKDESEAVASAEAEQQTLGALLLDNARVSMVAQSGGASLFYDPVHAAIYDRIAKLERDGLLASPVTLKEWALSDEGMKDLGGARYLARLAACSISPDQIPHYLTHLSELAARRKVLAAIDEARADIVSGTRSAGHVAAGLEASLLTVEGGTGPRPVSIMQATTDAAQQVMAAHDGEPTKAVATGIKALDRLITGLFPGELILLGGRPSMGKTAVAINVAVNAARSGRKVAFCSLEMGPEAVALRCLSESMAAQGKAIAYRDLRSGRINDKEAFARAVEEVAALPIQFLPREYQDAGALLAGAKRASALLGGLDLVVVDYVQLMRASSAKNRYEVITEVSTALKRLAAQLDAPVLALSQLSRQVEQRDDKRPQMSDLRESGQLEQDADACLFCYRDEYYLEREPTDHLTPDQLEGLQAAKDAARNRLEIIVAKQRQGPIGTARVLCNVAFNRIWEPGP